MSCDKRIYVIVNLMKHLCGPAILSDTSISYSFCVHIFTLLTLLVLYIQIFKKMIWWFLIFNLASVIKNRHMFEVLKSMVMFVLEIALEYLLL